MKNRIGVLGLGVRSTNFYTNLLHQKFHNHLGDYHTFPFLLYQIDFNRINPFLPNQFDKLLPVLKSCITEIEEFSIEKWLIPNITLHEALDKINHQLSLFHPLEIAVNYCFKQKIENVVIFGTFYSMNSVYLKMSFKNKGINVDTISKDDMIVIDKLRTKIYQSSENQDDLSNYLRLLKKYSKNAYVVIACTELSILSGKIDSKKIIDLAQLQINEAFNHLNNS